MTKEELAEQYANEKTAEFTQAIKEAYLKGYEQGELKTASTINVDGVEYVDLGLPSGTLWSSHAFTEKAIDYSIFSYLEAEKLNIPTEVQFEEFCKYTKTIEYPDTKGRKIGIIGINGNRIEICTKDYILGFNHYIFQGEGTPSDSAYFWLKSDIENGEAKVARVSNFGIVDINKHFAGYKLPVFLVKKKSEL